MNTFLFIAAIIVIVSILVYHFRYFIVNFVCDIYLNHISDEHLEKIIRLQYEVFERNRKAFSIDGVHWLKDMAEYICSVWSKKVYSHCLSEPKDRDNVSDEERQSFKILYFWQDAFKNLTYELNRREYFTS